jgi:hypothetical protein
MVTFRPSTGELSCVGLGYCIVCRYGRVRLRLSLPVRFLPILVCLVLGTAVVSVYRLSQWLTHYVYRYRS